MQQAVWHHLEHHKFNCTTDVKKGRKLRPFFFHKYHIHIEVFMSTVREIIDAFDTNQMTKVEQYLKSIASNRDGRVFNLPTEKDTTQTRIDRAYKLLYDLGDGPLTNGLRALEVMSNIISGVSEKGYMIFNRYPMVFSASEMINSDDESAFRIVLFNLKMDSYFEIAKNLNLSDEVSDYKNMCILISKRIKSGSLKFDDFYNTVLNKSKKLIKLTLNKSGV